MQKRIYRNFVTYSFLLLLILKKYYSFSHNIVALTLFIIIFVSKI